VLLPGPGNGESAKPGTTHSDVTTFCCYPLLDAVIRVTVSGDLTLGVIALPTEPLGCASDHRQADEDGVHKVQAGCPPNGKHSTSASKAGASAGMPGN